MWNIHSIKVWELMQKYVMEKTWDKDYANDMFILWYLHDIGKQFWYTIDHAQKGWEILRKSDYKYWREVYYHWSIDIEYDSPELDLLNFSDLQVLQDWSQVTIKERLDDIWSRYGIESFQYKNAVLLAEKLIDLM